MNIENQKFEEWRKEQIASLMRMGYPDAAKAFRDLGSVQWAGFQAGWIASRAAVVVELPDRRQGKYCDLRGFDDVMFCDDCRKAMEAIGLKVSA